MNRIIASFTVVFSFVVMACSKTEEPFAQKSTDGTSAVATAATAETKTAPTPSAPTPTTVAVKTSARLVPSSVAVSNFMDQPGDHHPKEHAVDGKANTAWCTHGNWKGEWVELTFEKPVTVTRVSFHTGWDYVSSIPSSGDLFVKNWHVKTARIIFDDANPVTLAVAETERQKTFDVKSAPVQKLRISADDVWPGKDNDFCISEISVWGFVPST